MAAIRGAVSKNKLRFKEGKYDLDLTYITKNIIAMGFPSQGTEAAYRNPMTEASCGSTACAPPTAAPAIAPGSSAGPTRIP